MVSHNRESEIVNVKLPSESPLKLEELPREFAQL